MSSGPSGGSILRRGLRKKTLHFFAFLTRIADMDEPLPSNWGSIRPG